MSCSAIVRVGDRTGNRSACAQKRLEPTHVRLLREIGAVGLRSIECEFDHLFLVKTTSWQSVTRLPDLMTCSAIVRVGDRTGNRPACAQKK
jgi:hypothetical protein